ncbi:MAG: hypothetical protein K2V38_15800 [Gemmataceae bacterium]|nr:hypothetical protein [Gemmataceae bacterium]
MPVYFVHRCVFGAPTETFLTRFEHDTVLDWARAVWRRFDTREEGERYARELFPGTNVDAFHHIFHPHADYALAQPPRDMDEVGLWFDAIYCEDTAHGPHHIQVMTEWDDNQRAIYVFDDHYRAANPGKADFLLLDGWRLPAGESDDPAPEFELGEPAGTGDGEGQLYFCDNCVGSKYQLEDLNAARHVEGVRLPDLARYLLLQPKPDDLDFALAHLHDGLKETLAAPAGEDAGFLVALRDEPDERTHWDAYSDWLQERDLPPAGLHLLERALRAKACGVVAKNHKPELDLVQVTPHFAQACKHEGCYTDGPKPGITEDDVFVRFIFFDDRWAAAHPVLSRGIVAFAGRWDVLT